MHLPDRCVAPRAEDLRAGDMVVVLSPRGWSQFRLGVLLSSCTTARVAPLTVLVDGAVLHMFRDEVVPLSTFQALQAHRMEV